MSDYHYIEKAAIEIAYDNSYINRDCTEESVRKRLDDFISNQEKGQIDLVLINVWLETLDDETFEILCCGDVSDIEDIMESAPLYVEALLNNWFDYM